MNLDNSPVRRLACQRRALPFALAATLAAGTAAAQTGQLEPVVVSASGMPQALADAIPTTSVYTHADIARSGKVSLTDLLSESAGVDLVRSGGAGGLSSVFMRGAEARQVLVLIDGVRIESGTAGTARIENLMLENIERVEVVRGNVSAIYGSAAVGGVVQVFTRRGTGQPRANAALGFGSRGEARLNVGSSGTFGVDGASDYSVQASHYRTSGRSAIDPRILPTADPDRDGYRNSSFSGSLGHRISSQHRIGARLYWSDARADLDDSFAVGPARAERQDSRLTIASAWWEAQPTAGWHSRVQTSVVDERSHNRYASGASDPFDTRRNELEWRNEASLAGGTLSLGLAGAHERILTDIPYDRNRRTSRSAFGGYAISFGPHHLELAGRYDDYSDVGDATTGSLGYSYALDESWKLVGRVATAFNAPTFNHLFYPGFSNPDLDPERARSLELGVQFQRQAARLRATAFRTRYTDLIDSPPPTFLPANVARAQVQGVELVGDATLGAWRLAGNATFQSPRNRSTGETLLRRARYFGALELSRRIGSWEAGGNLAWNGSRHDFRIDTFAPVQLRHRTLLGLYAQRELAHDLSLILRMDNITDNRTSTAHGYLVPGRSVFAMLRWQSR